MVQSKGEEVAEFFLYVLQQLTDAYVDLRPWLADVGFMPSPLVQSRAIINTDPGTSQLQGHKPGPRIWTRRGVALSAGSQDCS